MSHKRVARLLSSLRRWSWPHYRSSSGLVGGPQRPRCRRLCLEVLEDRLPPGDVLLGALLGSALWGPSFSPNDPELWTPEGTSAGSLPAGPRGAGQSSWTATISGSLAVGPVLTTANRPAEQPRREGGEAGNGTAPLLAGENGDGPRGSAPALFDVDALFASALTGPLPGSGAPRRGGAATPPGPAVGPAPGGGEAGGGGGAAALPNVAAGASAGGPGVAQPGAPAAGAGSSPAALSYYAGLPGALAQPGAAPAGPSASPSLREQAPAVHALFNAFDLSTITASPFPSNRFTVADASNLTGLRVNLPLPDPTTNPSDYQDTQVLNTLDGFNLQPRLSIPFDGPIDVSSVNSQDVFLINLGDTVDHQEHGDHIVGINQVVWDPATNTLHAESDQLLDQHTRYALIVTNGVLADGQPVQASEDFTRFRHDLNFGQTHDPGLKEYRKDLLDAVAAAEQVGTPESDIVTASVFTTESATAVLEKIRDQLHAATSAAADFYLGPQGKDGTPTVFPFNQVSGITLTQQIGWKQNAEGIDQLDQPVFGGSGSGPLNLSLLNLYPGKVGEIAFGSYRSPDYEVHPPENEATRPAGEYIPPVGTRTGTPVVQNPNNAIYFDLVLPSGTEPTGGWPVAIYGHGGGSNKDVSMTLVAASMANRGIATIIINDVGNGLGPEGTLTVNPGSPSAVKFSAGGRGIDQDGHGDILSQEGFQATQDWSLITARDGAQQTVADLMQLVRVIQVGMNVPSPTDDGSSSHLDPNRIYYFGWSNGANIGAPFLAVEPDVMFGAITNPGHGYIDEAGRVAPGNRPTVTDGLIARGLINSPGITSIDGVPVTGPYFDENMPLRNVPLPDGILPTLPTAGLTDGTTQTYSPPVTNFVPGAMAIQSFFDENEWAAQAGNPVAYAPHLRKDPLAGMPAKSVIVQFADGDQTAANPNVWALIRAGDLADRAMFYLHNLAYQDNSKLNKNPHRFLVATDVAAFRPIAFAAQGQIAHFFATALPSQGPEVINPSAVTQPPGVSLPPHFADYFIGAGTTVPIDPLTLEELWLKYGINLEGLNFIT
jgi:hypothetical protein